MDAPRVRSATPAVAPKDCPIVLWRRARSGSIVSSVRYADPFCIAGRPETTDHDFLLTCACGLEQRLDEMTLDEDGPIVLYECPGCETSVVGVADTDLASQTHAPLGMGRWEEKAGHELRGFTLGSRVDVSFRPEGADADLLVLPATPYFFKRYLDL